MLGLLTLIYVILLQDWLYVMALITNKLRDADSYLANRVKLFTTSSPWPLKPSAALQMSAFMKLIAQSMATFVLLLKCCHSQLFAYSTIRHGHATEGRREHLRTAPVFRLHL
jgi:predicted hotdog family 3-hydroxylacyl-ACP dehydratase